MERSIAGELYSDVMDQSNGEVGSKATLISNHFSLSANVCVIPRCDGDELWNEDELSWNDSYDELDRAPDLDREWQRRREQFHTIGYRDGLMAGKEASAQEGFNIGFGESVHVGYKWGLVRGVTSSLACLSDAMRKKLVESEVKRNKFLHLHECVNALSTTDALKLFHENMPNNLEKPKDTALSMSHEEPEHNPGSNVDLLETYYVDMQTLVLESPALGVHLETDK